MKPNLFTYATSELSQDAIICWIIDWINYDDCEMKKFALDFIKKILELHTTEFDEQKVDKVNLAKQYKNIDILINLYFSSGKILPIIIEDKTNTSMHSKQLETYLGNIVDENKDKYKYCNPIGVYYKTGYIYDYEIEKTKNTNYKIFSRKMMLNLMSKYSDNIDNDIFLDYYKHIEKLAFNEEKLSNIIQKDNISQRNELLKTYEGQWMFMKLIFNNIKGSLSHGSSKGRPWTHFNFLQEYNFKELPDKMFYRLDCRKEGYYLSLKQYLYLDESKCTDYFNELNKSDILEYKKKRLERLRRCFEITLEVLESKEGKSLVKGKVSNRGNNESEIGVFFINDKNTFHKFIRCIPKFHKFFLYEIEREFNILYERG
ncbi:PD-(D/E)XK nuclease family protein [Senegalia massiliensis]|uniref:PD-(D/E)XK nuclease superfamily protein n=1 Tax=Senegalia massiliensis TaxID=1720316 RepID=A0A845QVS4_9CLOT|nr:PD-(D/E)XK nuclease family protein [Senegalia massiliensis]NBI06104.1 hypothetical protein [Senegalia massiliensis]